MKLIARVLTVLVVIAVSTHAVRAAEPKLLSRELLDAGWVQLFDGETLFGWKVVGGAEWEAKDRVVRTDGAKPGFLMTTTEWANYELSVEFQAPATTNSGIFLRTPLQPKDPARDCYELNIAPADNPFPTGSIVGRQKVRDAESPSPNPSPEREGEQDEWHTFAVTCWGGWITAELDGERVADLSDDKPVLIGHIGLQCNRGPVAFRNVRLRPIELLPLLTTGDLSNFVTDRAEQCKFELMPDDDKDFALRLTNGPGQIETKNNFTNFVLQLECKVNGDALNSGIFYRTLREGRWAGYESQIHNGFKDGDRTKPVDFGTGGIYRRQPARRVVADDGRWISKTIVADGPHVAVWVDGYQVSDWTDDRPAAENAREGKRLKGGAIAIQGHDPTTDFSFRDFQVVELPR
jgi:3-keto-disaccharide hydrolase